MSKKFLMLSFLMTVGAFAAGVTVAGTPATSHFAILRSLMDASPLLNRVKASKEAISKKPELAIKLNKGKSPRIKGVKAPVSADGVSGMISDLKQMSARVGEINQAVQESLALKRKNEQKFDELNQQSAQYTADVNYYNSYCQGTFEQPEYEARLQWCNANAQPLQQRHDDLVKGYNDVEQSENERVAQVVALKNEYDSLQARMAAINRILAALAQFKDCSGIADPEQAAYCEEQAWDGAP